MPTKTSFEVTLPAMPPTPAESEQRAGPSAPPSRQQASSSPLMIEGEGRSRQSHSASRVATRMSGKSATSPPKSRVSDHEEPEGGMCGGVFHILVTVCRVYHNNITLTGGYV